MTFTISELAAMWKAGQRDQVRKAILESDDPQQTLETFANFVEFVEESDGPEEAIAVCQAFTVH
jgi:hypothetical protein